MLDDIVPHREHAHGHVYAGLRERTEHRLAEAALLAKFRGAKPVAARAAE